MKRIIKLSAIPVLIFMIAGAVSLKAQTNVYKIQSLFIYNFVKNIKWESVDQEFVIGVYGNQLAYKEVEANLNTKNVNGIKFRIVNVTNAAEAKSCHLLYLPKSNRGKIADLLSSANKPNLLTVTEEDMIAEGAGISFEMKDSKLSFIINKQKTDANGLKVSSALTSMGRVVG